MQKFSYRYSLEYRIFCHYLQLEALRMDSQSEIAKLNNLLEEKNREVELAAELGQALLLENKVIVIKFFI